MDAVTAAYGLTDAEVSAAGKRMRRSSDAARRVGEVRAVRLVFQRRGDTMEFHFYGNHDRVKAFLKNRR